MSRLRLTKVAAPSAPASTKAELFYSSADSKLEAIDESGNLAVLGGFATKDYRLIRIVVFATNQSPYTPTAGTKALYVECIGGGGAGGGPKATSSNASAAAGGGGGGYSASWLTSLAANYTITIGAGGTIGAAGAAGNAGGDTSFGSAVIAKGGGGGNAGTTAGTSAASSPAASAVAGTGDLAIVGTRGTYGVVLSATQACTGGGGSGYWGGGVTALQEWNGGASATWAGNPGNAPGAGGDGGYNVGTQSATTGSAGANGICRVWEFA